MSLQPFQRVALRADFPQHGLRAGDVATLIDLVPHPTDQSKPHGCVLEVFNALGDSIAVITVPETSVQPLRADEVLAIRPLAKAG